MDPYPYLRGNESESQNSIQLGFQLTNNFTSAETELKDEDVNFDSLWQQWPWTNGAPDYQEQPLQTNQLPVLPSQPIQKPQISTLQVDNADHSRSLQQTGHINWRKYGEKILKGRESMGRVRAYFKCTYPNCEVRKHVEKAVDGSAADVVTITGVHNHNLQPQGRTRVMKADAARLYGDTMIAEPQSKRAKQVNVSLNTRVLGLVSQNQNNFVVADPHIADCPIIFASSGFCHLTGYELTETLGRNCRHLQGVDTNMATVKQISQALKNREEIHVILLNYCKNGTPFWNLLHLSPVLDAEQRLVSFVGSQVNVSAAVGAHQTCCQQVGSQHQQLPLPLEGIPTFIGGSTSGNDIGTFIADMSTPLQMSPQMSQQSTIQQQDIQQMSQIQQVEMENQ